MITRTCDCNVQKITSASHEIERTDSTQSVISVESVVNTIMNDFDPKIVAMVCTYCTYTAADMAGSMRLQYPHNVRPVKLPCTGRIDVLHILRTFQAGADGVLVGG